jgi:N-acetylglucosamine-6-phosphate deacetylase
MNPSAASDPPEFRVVNAEVLLPDRAVPDGALHVRDGRIAAVGRRGSLGPWDGPVLDASAMGAAHVAPGFVDLHVHGGDGADFMDGDEAAFAAVLAAHGRHGVTSVIPTSTVADRPRTLRFLELARRFRLAGPDPARGLPRAPGAHLYGPFFAPDKVGCHPRLPARPPGEDDTAAFLEFADTILTATCAPELPGAIAFYRAAAARGIRLNAGHSNACWDEMAAAFDAGVRHVDHLYCAMSSVQSLRTRFGVPMRAGMGEFVLATPEMTTEVIADGMHLSADLLRFAVRMLGVGRLALVSDSSRAMDMPDGRYVFGPRDAGEPFDKRDGLGWSLDGASPASSVVGLDHMVAHMARVVGLPLHEAVRMASLTPARIAGLDRDLGSLDPGKSADFVLLGPDLSVRGVWVGGKELRRAV